MPPPSLLVLFLHQSACLLYLAKFAYILIHKILNFSVLTFSHTKKTFFRLKICYRSDRLIFVFPLFPAKIFLELKIYYWSDCQSVRRAFNTAGVEGWVGDFQTIIKSNEKVSEMTGNHCICVFSFPM